MGFRVLTLPDAPTSLPNRFDWVGKLSRRKSFLPLAQWAEFPAIGTAVTYPSEASHLCLLGDLPSTRLWTSNGEGSMDSDLEGQQVMARARSRQNFHL